MNVGGGRMEFMGWLIEEVKFSQLLSRGNNCIASVVSCVVVSFAGFMKNTPLTSHRVLIMIRPHFSPHKLSPANLILFPSTWDLVSGNSSNPRMVLMTPSLVTWMGYGVDKLEDYHDPIIWQNLIHFSNALQTFLGWLDELCFSPRCSQHNAILNPHIGILLMMWLKE